MPIKDIVKNRDYQREWARRKRLGISTKIVNKHRYKSTIEEKRLREEERILKLTPEERKTRIEKQKKQKRCKRDAEKHKLGELIGKDCYVCTSKISLIAHEIYGIPHEGNGQDQYVDAFERPQDFVRVCYACHKGIHWAMKYMNMTWIDISTNLKIIQNKNNLIT